MVKISKFLYLIRRKEIFMACTAELSKSIKSGTGRQSRNRYLAEKKKMKFVAQLIISALAILITTAILPGVRIDSVLTGIIVAAVLSLLNVLVKPILIILTIPITIVTLGLFLLVINALIILLASKIVPGFYISGFWTALFFSIILSFITSIFNQLARKEEE